MKIIKPKEKTATAKTTKMLTIKREGNNKLIGIDIRSDIKR